MNGDNKGGTDQRIAFACGHISAWLDLYARGHGIPETELTYRVALFLLSSSSGEVHRAEVPVQDVRGTPTEGTQGKRKVAVARGTRTGRAPLSANERIERRREKQRRWYRKNRKRLLAEQKLKRKQEAA